MEEWLIVDGYNVIGAHTDWSALPLEEARRQLASLLSEYKAVTGRKVMLVFDAHRSPGAENREMASGITVWFTREHETADQLIERLVRQHKKPGRHIYVATSDYLEQRMVFGQGAYRLSARELIRDLSTMKGNIAQRIREAERERYTLGQGLKGELLEALEKWRRKK
ncbi:NYN domain-containing protein [Salinithrix halophila]|uniref:NYN domain-containing protein n=1 Tax=Salinithrix halophila TaxID=1485204 RepID=A0ABV8JAU1_9BACL